MDGGPDGPLVDAPPPCVPAAAFDAEQSFSVGSAGTALVARRFGGNTAVDVAVAVGDGIQIMIGNGAGTFSQGMKIPAAADGLVSDDFDGDGDYDLVAFDVGGAAVSGFRQAAGGFLAEQPLESTFTGVQGVLVGQFDGQFIADVVVRDAAEARAHTSRLGAPGTFAPAATSIGGLVAGDALVAVGQFDGQLRDDAAFVSVSGEVKIAFNGPSFSSAVIVAGGARDRCVGFGQFDDTAEADLVVCSDAGGVIYRGSGGTFTALSGTIPALTGPTLQVADVNGDNKDDLVLANRIVYQCAPQAMGGPGVFTQVEPIDASGVVLVADITDDGKPDLLRLVGTELKVRVQQ